MLTCLLPVSGWAQSGITYVNTSTLADSLAISRQLVPVAWQNLDLNRTGTEVGDHVMRGKGVQHPHVAFTWQSDDQTTNDWYPQGITGLRAGNGAKFLVISWYAKNEDTHKGVKLSFVDVTSMNRIRYRHVLLVQPAESGSGVFAPIRIHAGGLATIGSTIFVADTHEGVRVFDADKIFRAEADPSRSKVGIIAGKAYAYDYRYILPQKGTFKLPGPPFSFLDVDWSDPADPKLISGAYHQAGEEGANSLSWWKLAGDSILTRLKDTRDEGLPLKNLMQGASSLNDILYLSTSGSNAKLFVGKPPFRTFRSYSWPHGTEDLHIALQSKNLWCLSEHPGDRRVWAVKYENYAP